MRVRAKMYVTGKTLSKHINRDGTEGTAAQVQFSCVYRSPTPEMQAAGDYRNAEVENRLFGDATPSGSLTMYIVNENAHKHLVPGRHYYVDIEACPDEMQPAPLPA